jgi:MFS transporter, ACS family, allantoate permease
VFALIASGYAAYKLRNRILVSMVGLIVGLIGIILIVALPTSHNGGRLAGYYMTQCSVTPFVALLSLISSNVAGYTKKTTVAAIYLISYCVGNIIGPQTFRPKDAPTYRPGEITIICCMGACLIDLCFIYWYCKKENKRKEVIRADPEYVKLENLE